MNKLFIKKLANEILSKTVHNIDDLFEYPFAKIAMSAGELIFKTNQRSIKYAKGCVSTSKRNDPKNGRWTFSVKCKQDWSKGPYDVHFKLLKGKGAKTQGMLGREVEISCNCNAWKYNGADFNALDKDYSERQYSDGTSPNIRDPQRRYLICKHVAASIPLFKKFLIPEGFKDPLKPSTRVIKRPKLPVRQVQKTMPQNPALKTPNVRTQPQVKKPERIKPIKPGQKNDKSSI